MKTFLLFLLAWVLARGIAEHAYTHVPKTVAVSEEGLDPKRIALDLEAMVGDGVPHPMGSEASERVAARLVDTLHELGYLPQLDSRFVCSPMAMCGRPQNVMARLAGTSSASAILVTAHYDSTPATPGAYDNALGVAVVLELARILSASKPAHDIIFLFDDGEEVGLLGAEAFSRHPWWSNVRVVVNVDGMGGPTALRLHGGRDTFLLEAVRKTKQPYLSSFSPAFERFSVGYNDARVYAPYVPVVGVEGYREYSRYHNPLDRAHDVAPGAILSRGAETLRLVQGLANSPLDAAPSTATYFDLFGRVLIFWPTSASLPLALVVLMLTLIGAWRDRYDFKSAPADLGLSLGALVLGLLFQAAFLAAFAPGSEAALSRLRSGLLVRELAGLWGLTLLPLLALRSDRWDPQRMFRTVLLAMATAGVVVALWAPQAAYLWIAPTALAALLAFFARVRAGLIATILATSLGAALLDLTPPSGGWLGTLAHEGPRLLALIWFVPVLLRFSERHRTSLLLAAPLLVTAVSLASLLSSAEPEAEPGTLRLVEDARTGKSEWIWFGEPSPGLEGSLRFQERAMVFPWSSGFRPARVATATVSVGPPPVFEDVTTSTDGWIRGTVRSDRAADELLVALPAGQVTEARVESENVALTDGAWTGGFSVINLPGADSVYLELKRVAGAPLEFWLADTAYGIPERAADPLRLREPHRLPTHSGDATTSLYRVRIP